MPYIKDEAAQALSKSKIEGLYNRLLNDGLDPQTVDHVHARLRAAFYWGVSVDLVTRNIFAERKVDASKLKKDVSETAKVRSPEEIDRILVVASSTRWSAPIFMAIRFGVRRGESCGLKFADVDYRTRTLVVQRSISETKTKGIIVKGLKRGAKKNPRSGR